MPSMESTEHNPPSGCLLLVDDRERWALHLGGSVLYYRRLSLAAAAAIERQQTVLLPAADGGPPQAVLPAAALEAARAALERRAQPRPASAPAVDLAGEILDYVLLEWRGVTSPLGEAEVPCTRDNKLKLPTPVKLKILAAAQALRAEDLAE